MNRNPGQRTASDQGADSTDRTRSLSSLQTEAEDLGKTVRADAFRRISLMGEVRECLEGESLAAAAEVGSFCVEALDKLVNHAEDDGFDDAALWVLRESDSRWGDYLRLIDPATEADPTESPPSEDLNNAPASIDAGTLFRLLTCNLDTSDHVEADWADGSLAEFQESDLSPGVPNLFGTNSGELSEILARFGGSSPEPETSPPEGSRPPTHEFEIPPPPSYFPIDPELRETFLAEATDLFDRLETLVLSLGRGVRHSEILNELGRCFHTLKGAAGSVGLGSVAAVIHATEEELEKAEGEATDSLVEYLHKLLHYLEEVFIALRRGDSANPAPEEFVQRKSDPPPAIRAPSRSPAPLSTERRKPSNQPPEASFGVSILTTLVPSPPTSSASAVVTEGSASEGPVRLSSERVDELMDLASELISRRGLWETQAESMKEFATMARTCRLRLAATLDRIRDLAPETIALRTRVDRKHDLTELLHRLDEQSEDLAVVTESARSASKPLSDNSDALARLTLQLWESLQAVRIVPVKGLFQRLARVSHDAARVEGRQVNVEMVGEETGVDRALQDKAFEPLLHVVRNAVCHGIEPPAERIRAGKSAAGRVTLEAVRSGNTLTLSVQDDGRGLDYDAIAAKGRRIGLIAAEEHPGIDRLNALIFQPGFSTRDSATAIAGRGVGMDVVSQEVGRLHGTVSLSSRPNQGTCLSLCLPARLSLQQAMLLRLDGQAFALPVELIELAQSFQPEDLDWKGVGPRIRIRDFWAPVLSAREALGMPPASGVSCPKLLLIRADGEPLAVVVDAIDGTRELVFKPLGMLISGHPLVSGIALSVTGEVILALNPSGLARWLREGSTRGRSRIEPVEPPSKITVLVVDDSISVRKVVAKHLRNLGFDVEQVSDGLEALGKLRSKTYGLVVSDLEMPRMDGFELLAELRRLEIAQTTPVIVTSTRSDAETRRRVIELGARDFVPKPIDSEELSTKVRALMAKHT